MHRRLPILEKLTGSVRVPTLVITALVVGLSMTARAQETGSGRSAASADQSFNALHQALSATANDLLASTQRPSAVAQDHPDRLRDSSLPLDHDSPGAGQSEKATPLRQALLRVEALRPSLEPLLREEGIPPQMAAVILVESGGQVAALSPKGARGLWQIMPDTARRYGLVVSNRVDERLDPYKSTRAAARYLRDLRNRFGDWRLALAAYNAGGEAVEKAIGRAATRDFSLIARAGILPLETRNYVPAVLSAITMLNGDGTYLSARTRKSASNAVVYAGSHPERLEAYE